MNWDQFVEFVLDRESRVVHHDPRDPGGQTAWGISRKFHPGWPGWVLVDRGISSGPQFESLVRAFYRDFLSPYWDHLPPRLREAVCDAIVNMGPGRAGDQVKGAVEILQHAMNRIGGSEWVKVDGSFGPKTKAAVKTMDPGPLAFAVCAFRLAEYSERARRDPSARVFLAGWLRRVHLLMEAI
jgi:lysozyme family protein